MDKVKKSGELNRIEKIAMGIPTNWYEDLVMFFDPSMRGIRSYLTDKDINEIVTKGTGKEHLRNQVSTLMKYLQVTTRGR